MALHWITPLSMKLPKKINARTSRLKIKRSCFSEIILKLSHLCSFIILMLDVILFKLYFHGFTENGQFSRQYGMFLHACY